MKILDKAELRRREQVEHTQLERKLLQRIKHPFMVDLRFAFQSKDRLYLVMDYIAGW